jgi:hypothetical protein
MGKKQRLHQQALVVEESREPAAYSLATASAGGDTNAGKQPKSSKKRRTHSEPAAAAAAAVEQEEEQQQQQQQQQQQWKPTGATPAAGHHDLDDGGYDGDGTAGWQQLDGSYTQAAGAGGGSRVDPETLAYLTEVCCCCVVLCGGVHVGCCVLRACMLPGGWTWGCGRGRRCG